MLIGKQSWRFTNTPVILSTGGSGGPFEKNGKLAEDFYILHDDLWMEKATVFYSHLLNQIKKVKYKRLLILATGALLSPLSDQ
jgi:hypothetical protein